MTPTANPLAGRRVLLVEDDRFIATSLLAQFEASGARGLGPVPSVGDALAPIAASPGIGAAVLDINLQEEAVYPVADAPQARGVPFVFATGTDRTTIPAPHAAA